MHFCGFGGFDGGAFRCRSALFLTKTEAERLILASHLTTFPVHLRGFALLFGGSCPCSLQFMLRGLWCDSDATGLELSLARGVHGKARV